MTRLIVARKHIATSVRLRIQREMDKRVKAFAKTHRLSNKDFKTDDLVLVDKQATHPDSTKKLEQYIGPMREVQVKNQYCIVLDKHAQLTAIHKSRLRNYYKPADKSDPKQPPQSNIRPQRKPQPQPYITNDRFICLKTVRTSCKIKYTVTVTNSTNDRFICLKLVPYVNIIVLLSLLFVLSAFVAFYSMFYQVISSFIKSFI